MSNLSRMRAAIARNRGIAGERSAPKSVSRIQRKREATMPSMTDAEFNDLIKRLGLHQRRKALDSLMVGNDSQCFTTQQYRERYADINLSGDRHFAGWLLTDELVREHMRSMRCQEVSPGIWTPRRKGDES